MTRLTGNNGGLFRKTTASGLVCLLLVACAAAAAAAAESCKGWKTAKFFESATLQQVRACLSAGEDPNKPDTTRIHRLASGGTGDLRSGSDRGVAGSGRQPEGVQYSRKAALAIRAEERQDQRLGRLSAAQDSVSRRRRRTGPECKPCRTIPRPRCGFTRTQPPSVGSGVASNRPRPIPSRWCSRTGRRAASRSRRCVRCSPADRSRNDGQGGLLSGLR